MRRTAFLATAMLGGAAAFGQGLLDCIDPDVLHGLLLPDTGLQPSGITAVVPQEISALKMPGQFTWVGSSERMAGRVDASTTSSQVMAAWRSSLPADAARTATIATLVAAGWEIRPFPEDRSVFSPGALDVLQTACRDGKQLGFLATTMEGMTYVKLSILRGSGFLEPCSQPVRPARQGTTTGLEPYLPRLAMPMDPATGQVALLRRADTGFSGTTINAKAEFTMKDSVGNVARHFARQMVEQGWISDATWNGASTAGSSWSRRPDASTLIHGTLSVTAVADGDLRAALRINRLQ